jgi:hypothetical protein
MPDSQQSRAIVDDQARASLHGEFPSVSPRIISAVLAAYGRITPTVTEAVDAARARILDARAT